MRVAAPCDVSKSWVAQRLVFRRSVLTISSPISQSTPEFCAEGLKLLVRDVADGNEGNGTVFHVIAPMGPQQVDLLHRSTWLGLGRAGA